MYEAKSFKAFPPLYNFDDYDACLNNKTSGIESTYCMVYAEIRPQNSSKLWRQISQHTDEYKFHFRRDRLFFGVCLERCKNFPMKLDNNYQYNDSRLTNKITQFFDAIHKRPLDLQMRSEYHDLVHNCLNSDFQEMYGLDLRIYIEYCERSKETPEKDTVEKVFYKFLQVIIILNIFSTFYDLRLKSIQPDDQQNAEYYKVNPQQPELFTESLQYSRLHTKFSFYKLSWLLLVFHIMTMKVFAGSRHILTILSILLTAFSIPRNYYRLVEPSTSQLSIDLSYLDGIRSICVIFIIFGHAYFIQYYPVKNSEIFENFAKNPTHMWLINGTLLLEIFHILSGMLLYLKFTQFFNITPQTSIWDCFKAFGKGVKLRYIRFFPSLALFLLVNATFFIRLQDGPFWRHLSEPVRTFSREKWWKNLFIIDNISESGHPHTWYMTSDWQMFAFYVCVLTIIRKYPQLKKKILTSLAILTVLIPFSISYFYKTEPCFLISPESFRYIHVGDEEKVYHRLFIPFYSNLGGYLFGIVCGEIYEKYCHNAEFHKQLARIPNEIFEFAFWSCIALGVWICWLGTVLIFHEPSLWTALYAGLNRNLFVVIVFGGLVFLGMFCKSLSISEHLCHPAFRILARLSFQLYLWHFSILYLLNGHIRDPMFVNHLQHATTAIALFLFSLCVAFLVTILVEYPIQRIAYYYYKKGKTIKVPTTDIYPQYKKVVLTSLAILAVIIPFSICYFYKIDPCFLISPESFRFIHVKDEEAFHKLYTPFYTNLGGYLFGIICGEIYEKYCHNADFHKRLARIPSKIFEFAFWLCIAIGVWICWLGSVFIFYEPSLWTALYAGLNRNLIVVIVFGGLVFLGMFCKTLSVSELLCHSAFRILARLSFQIYLWHFSILHLLNGHKREPIFVNHLQHAVNTIGLVVFSLCVAFIVTIAFEYPLHKVAYYCHKREKTIEVITSDIETKVKSK
ncbi:uncharacterized protein LOC111678138 [Lucilia cuprina]|uniref:uncharacterized protein LOC111678138 n=1 Tax=Lucilia cuprina TaxID=7375 RepID=UPI001F06749B|nr:uncharacterized protein LOC111678138 [Lucilia cuprina]